MNDAIKFASTQLSDTRLAVNELKQNLSLDSYSLISVFYSASYELEVLRDALLVDFPNTEIVGCSTAGEIGVKGYSENSISAVAFSKTSFQISVHRYDDLKNLSVIDWHDVTVKFHSEHNLKCGIQSDESTFGFLLIDGMSRREEPFTRIVCNAISGIPVVGGSAGDDLYFNPCPVLHNSDIATDSAVLVLITTPLPFRLYKTQNVLASEQRMVVTGAIPELRVITEINGFPAAEEYARICNLNTVGELSSAVFAAHPVVVVMGDEQYVRSIQHVNPDHSLTFYCAIDQGIVMRLGTCTDLVESMDRTLTQIVKDIGGLACTVTFDCILRRLQLQEMGELEHMSKVLKSHNAIGFSTYGEQFNGLHVNQTCAGIAIGALDE
jgi:hypothetical protein